MSNISISNIISMSGIVLSANTNLANLVTNGLTENILVPASSRTLTFNNTTEVGNYFGTTSDEYLFASKYFPAWSNANTLPRQILFSRYVATDTSAYMFGKSVTATQFNDLKLIASPTFAAVINGTTRTLTISQAELVACTGLTDVAALIETKLAAALVGSTCTVIGTNQISISAPPNSALSTISYCTGNVAALLNLASAQAPTLSQGTAGGTPADNVDAIINANSDFLALSYVTRLTGDTKEDGYPITVALTAKIATYDYEYIGLWWEGGAPAATTMWSDLVDAGFGTTLNGVTTFSTLIQLDYNESAQAVNQYTTNEVGIYSAFVGGMGASIDYTQADAKLNFAGKTQNGLAVNVTNDTDYKLLLNRGYNVYGRFASKSNAYNLSETGSIGGSWLWIDNIYDANWLFDAIINACARLLNTKKRIPYNTNGQADVNAVVTAAATQYNNGVIEAGNIFTPEQTQAIIELVGRDITPILTSTGYYIYFPPITAQQRSNRSPMQFYFLYTNDGNVNGFAIGGVFIQ